ncbi:NifZ family protein [Burkholderiales bacterium GJ-E10]|nr:NifZ family protein [Burkholderiales bacterium GJ-E10]
MNPDLRTAKYQWGQPVIALKELVNDGSYPDCAADEPLAAEGAQGEIVRVGTMVEGNIPIYLVAFGNGRVVGCLEEEIGAL